MLGATALITIAVRAIGLGGQGLITARFGASAPLDAYFIALLVPGLVVTPLAGAVEAVVLPRLARQRSSRPGEEIALAGWLVRTTAFLGGGLALVVTAAVPLLVYLTSPGAGGTRHEYARQAAFLIYPSILPQLLTAVGTVILISRGRLVAPVAASAVNPLTVLLVLGTGRRDLTELALAVFGGYVLEALIVMGLVGRTAWPREVADRGDIVSMGREMRPLLLTHFVMRGVPLADQVFASTLDAGGLARFAIAMKLYEVAFALLLVPNGRMAVLRLARHVGKSREAIAAAARREVRIATAMGVASAAAFAIGAPAVLFVVYRHGNFRTEDAWATARIAWMLAPALIAFGPYVLLPRLLVSLGDARFLVRLGIGEVVANVLLDALLTPAFGAVGIAAATGGSYGIVLVIGLRRLRLALPKEDRSGPRGEGD